MITTNRETLVSALERCARVAHSRGTIPAISRVLLQANGALHYTATNLRHEVSGKLPSSGTGTILASAKDLLGAVQALEGDDVTLDPRPGFVHLKGSTKRSFKLPTIDPAEFPAAMVVGGKSLELDGAELSRFIESVVWSVRAEADRPEQAAVRIVGRDGTILAMATDGKSLGLLRVKSDLPIDLLIPTETARMLIGRTGTVKITSEASAMAFQFGDEKIAALAPAGQFPPVERQLEHIKSGVKFTVDAERLRNAVKALQRVDADRDIALKVEPGLLALECAGAEGSSRDEIEIGGGALCEAWLKASNISDGLARISGEVEVGCDAGFEPFIITQGEYVLVSMPLQPAYVEQKKRAK